MTTVGYGDLEIKTAAGEIFAVIFMLAGAGTVLFALTVLLQTIACSRKSSPPLTCGGENKQ